ncbi:MAG: hypothetical protein GY714_03825 [Desulfobacterales bacterium]|nr:hypothetical protein [Desulfobacterales bacterium]
MSITVKKHPLAEILSKKLFGIETVPVKEQKRMVNRAIKAAVEYHEGIPVKKELKSMGEQITEMITEIGQRSKK